MRDTPAASASAAPPSFRALALRLAIAAIVLWLTLPVLIANVDTPIKLIIGIAFLVSAIDPRAGLLMIAFFGSLTELLGPIAGTRDFRIGEAMVLAFLGGWLLWPAATRRGPRIGSLGSSAAWLLAATIAASMAGLAWQLTQYPGELAWTLDRLSHLYFFAGDGLGASDGARLLEGIGLAIATVTLFRRFPSLAVSVPLTLASSAGVAGLASVLLWRGIGTPAALARYKAIGYRVSAHVGDVNAAGSYFAMIVCLAAGMAMRERGVRRWLWFGLAAASTIGLWFSESRSAIGAAVGASLVALLWVATARIPAKPRAAALALLVIALLGGALIRARMIEQDPTYRGAGFREQFVETSLRMIEARPLFGVGIGQYRRVSPVFLSPQLAWTYGTENAHNYFLQLGGELGLVGLGLFLIWIGAAIARAVRAMTMLPRDWRLLGVSAGIMVFVTTCLSGHPLLVAEVAWPFWIQFGLMIALAESAWLNNAPAALADDRSSIVAPGWQRWAAGIAAIVIVWAGPVLTANATVDPPRLPSVDGFYAWETAPDGVPFRWTGPYASLFVPATVTDVEVPIRLPVDGHNVRPMGVEIMTAGIDRGRTIIGATWTVIHLRLPDTIPPTRYKRIDLKVDRVWQPALLVAGSPDLRSVGVQVGEVRQLK